MALGVERLAGGADAFDPVAGEDRLHLLEHRAQALGIGSSGSPSRSARSTLSTASSQSRMSASRASSTRRSTSRATALAVVVEVGERALVAVLELARAPPSRSLALSAAPSRPLPRAVGTACVITGELGIDDLLVVVAACGAAAVSAAAVAGGARGCAAAAPAAPG